MHVREQINARPRRNAINLCLAFKSRLKNLITDPLSQMHHMRTQTKSVSHDGVLTNICECIRALYLIEGRKGGSLVTGVAVATEGDTMGGRIGPAFQFRAA